MTKNRGVRLIVVMCFLISSRDAEQLPRVCKRGDCILMIVFDSPLL